MKNLQLINPTLSVQSLRKFRLSGVPTFGEFSYPKINTRLQEHVHQPDTPCGIILESSPGRMVRGCQKKATNLMWHLLEASTLSSTLSRIL